MKSTIFDSHIKAYIFDMDGTLVDNCNFHVLAWREFSKKYGNELSERRILDLMGSRSVVFLENIFGRTFSDEENAPYEEEKESIYRSLYKPVLPDGLRELLDRAHAQNIRCAVASGGPPSNIKHVLGKLDLYKDFDAIIDSSMYSHSKPDPECFLKAAATLGIPPENCIVFEDAVPGIRAGKAAGMKVFATTFTLDREALTATCADVVFDSYRELLAAAPL